MRGPAHCTDESRFLAPCPFLDRLNLAFASGCVAAGASRGITWWNIFNKRDGWRLWLASLEDLFSGVRLSRAQRLPGPSEAPQFHFSSPALDRRDDGRLRGGGASWKTTATATYTAALGSGGLVSTCAEVRVALVRTLDAFLAAFIIYGAPSDLSDLSNP